MGEILRTVSKLHKQLVAVDAQYQQKSIKLPDLLLAVFLGVYVLTRIIPLPSLVANLLAAVAGLVCFGYVVVRRHKVPIWGCLVFGILFCLSLLASVIHNGNGNIYYALWVWAFLGVAMLIYSCRLNSLFLLAQYYAFALLLALYAVFGGGVKEFLAIGSENNISTYLILYFLVYLLSRRYSSAPVGLAPIVVAIVLTMWTGCRGGLLALGVLLIGAFLFNILRSAEKKIYRVWWRKLKSNKWLLAAAAATVVVAVVVVLTSDFFSVLIWKLTSYGGSSVRTQIWTDYATATFESIANVLLGPNITHSSYPWLAKYPGNPHNAFLSLHAHFGLIPFCMMGVALIWAIIWCWRRRNYIGAMVLATACVRSFFDWTAFPGPYDVFYFYFAVCLMDCFPLFGGVGHKAMRYNQKTEEVTVKWKDIGGYALKLYRLIKKAYSWIATLVYDMTSEVKMVETASLYDTPTMTRYHHIVSALRYVAVEEYYGQNDFGKELYINANHWESEEALKEDLDKFDALIKSIEARGYDKDSAIYVDLNGNCINGTHRLALCAWFEIKQMPVITIKRKLKTKTVEQLREYYHLSDEDFQRLEEAYGRMRAKLQR